MTMDVRYHSDGCASDAVHCRDPSSLFEGTLFVDALTQHPWMGDANQPPPTQKRPRDAQSTTVIPYQLGINYRTSQTDWLLRWMTDSLTPPSSLNPFLLSGPPHDCDRTPRTTCGGGVRWTSRVGKRKKKRISYDTPPHGCRTGLGGSH